MHDHVHWKTAPPLWSAALDGRIAVDRPALLRFATDDFMEQFQNELNNPDRAVAPFVARPETWRAPAVGLDATVAESDVLKLYQPTHGRFYLVTGALVCARYGLPDKVVNVSCGESSYFVLRRLEPTGALPVDPTVPATFRELGWVDGDPGRWVEVSTGLVIGESKLPLFPMSYTDKRTRRLLAGFVPVSSRERYETAVIGAPLPPASDDPALDLDREGADDVEQIIASLDSLLSLAQLEPLTPGEDGVIDDDSVEMFREAAFFTLVDLATFVREHALGVWNNAPRGTSEAKLAEVLNAGFPSTVNWLIALKIAWANRDAIFTDPADTPAPVALLTVTGITNAVTRLYAAVLFEPINPFDLPTLTDVLLDVVDPSPPSPPPVIGDAGGNTVVTAPTQAAFTEGAVYVSRFVYERPLCRPPDRLSISEPTEAFKLAHFYDADAPFRDNRIVLPVDTSLQGLRKFPRAVRMDMSAQLRKQTDRIQAIKLEDLDSGDIPPEKQLDLGMICSLSIPIITICALILLMIIVSLLNIVFFWMPLFKICRPKVG